MGLGAVVHTLNPRLFAVDLEYIINHGVADGPGQQDRPRTVMLVCLSLFVCCS